jgi:mannose-6-phosphate isomerase-like protein (cupin superfamily)
MHYVPVFCLLVLLGDLTATAQVLPTSNGSCRVTASGVESCNWMSGIRRLKADKIAGTDTPGSLFVTHYILAAGAPLNPPIEGLEVLIVGMGSGQLLNQKKSPPVAFDVTKGSVILIPKRDPYLLRNVGKQSLELLLIEVRK